MALKYYPSHEVLLEVFVAMGYRAGREGLDPTLTQRQCLDVAIRRIDRVNEVTDVFHRNEEAIVQGNIDWLNAIGEGVVTLAGPLGAPLKVLLAIRQDQKAAVNRVIDAQINGGVEPGSVSAAIEASGGTGAPGWAPRAYEAAVYAASIAKEAGKSVTEDDVKRVLASIRKKLAGDLVPLRT